MDQIDAKRPTWAEIELDDLAYNLRSMKSFAGDDIDYMAVVKADAYGHGAVECARRLEREGIDWFGVALPEEGAELREAGIKTPILCLGGFWPGQERLILDRTLTPTIFQIERARELNRLASERGITARVHVKVDTGMGRLGVRFDELQAFAMGLRELTNLHLEGVMTHFAAADDPRENEFTRLQIERYKESVAVLRSAGFEPTIFDLANSPGAVVHPESRGNLVRLGGLLYGLGGEFLPSGVDKPDLRPVLSLHTRIAHLKKVPAGETIGYGRTFTTTRESQIATVPIGYEDGYRRALSNIGRGIVRNRFAPVVGRISMDWTTLDVTDVGGVSVGDDVIFVGAAGGLSITAEEIAAVTGTISYEVTCDIDRRVPRVYT